VGIGDTNPDAKLDVYESTEPGDVLGNYQIITSFSGATSNNFMNNQWIYRDAAGGSWTTARWHDAISIDTSYLTPGTDTKTYWERDPNNNVQYWGSGASDYMTLTSSALTLSGNITVNGTGTSNIGGSSSTINLAGGYGSGGCTLSSTGTLTCPKTGGSDVFSVNGTFISDHDIIMDLDDDNDGSNSFIIRNGSNIARFIVDESGNTVVYGLMGGKNILPFHYASWEYGANGDSVPKSGNANSLTISTAYSADGKRSLRHENTAGGDNYAYISGGTYDIPVKPSTKYMLSAYRRTASGSLNTQIYARTNDSGFTHYGGSGTATASWTRISVSFTTASDATAMVIRTDVDQTGAVYWDKFMLEEIPVLQSAPSAWTPNSASSGIRMDGSENLVIPNKVGIGVATPGAKLDLRTSSGTALFVENTGVGSSFRVNDAATDSTPFIIDESGLVGIGDSTPSNRLDVAGSLGISDTTVISSTRQIQNWPEMTSTVNATMPNIVLNSTTAGDAWTSQGAYISLGESGDLGNAALNLTYVGNGYGYIGMGGVTSGVPNDSYLRFYYNSKDLYTDSNLTIGGSGKMAIGTTVPDDTALKILANAYGATPDTNGIDVTAQSTIQYDYPVAGRFHASHTNAYTWPAGVYATAENPNFDAIAINASVSTGSTGGKWSYFGRTSASGTGTNYGIYLDVYNSTTNNWGVYIYRGNAAKPGGGTWSTSSDINIKENISDISSALDTIRQLRPVQFQYKEPYRTEHELGDYMYYSFIAQEYETVFPSFTGMDDEGNKTIDIHAAWMYTTAALKELDQLAIKDGGAASYIVENNGDATEIEQARDSKSMAFRGSTWDTVGSAAVARDFSITNKVTDEDTYKLSFANNDDTEVMYLGQDGDVAIAGKLYLSDNGALQTNKYLYYDSSDDYIKTNAAGWNTGSYDFAERFPSDDALEPGELVMIDVMNSEHVKRADNILESNGYLLSGIVSTRPGFLAGMKEVGTYPVALEGRVPTKVNLENGAINIGDPITISSTPGQGMHADGQTYVVGIALETYDGTQEDDMITVFLKNGWYNGT
ncbi:tail fiber domain-containing protein, partial [Patescibacteria group bacterium]